MYWCVQTSPRSFSAAHSSPRRVLSAYRIDSSGENAKPLGDSRSVITADTVPSGAMRWMPWKSISPLLSAAGAGRGW